MLMNFFSYMYQNENFYYIYLIRFDPHFLKECVWVRD